MMWVLVLMSQVYLSTPAVAFVPYPFQFEADCQAASKRLVARLTEDRGPPGWHNRDYQTFCFRVRD